MEKLLKYDLLTYFNNMRILIQNCQETGKIIIPVLLLLTMTGCDNGIFSSNPFRSQKKNVVVISRALDVITTHPKVINLSTPLQVVGKTSSVCMVLESGVESDSRSLYNKIIGDITATAKLELTNGKKYNYTFLGRRWSRNGIILNEGELSVCLSENNKEIIPYGSSIRKISIETSAPLPIKGIFWESMNISDKRHD